MHHRLSEEAAGIGRANSDGRLSRGGNGAGEALVQQAAENHHGNVASFAIRYAQSVDKLAFNSHTLESGGGKFFSAPPPPKFFGPPGQHWPPPRPRLLSRPAAPPNIRP